MDRLDGNWKMVPYIAVFMLAMPAIVLMGVWGRERVGGWNGWESASPFFRILFSAVTLYYLVFLTSVEFVIWRVKKKRGSKPRGPRWIKVLLLMTLVLLYLAWMFMVVTIFPDLG